MQASDRVLAWRYGKALFAAALDLREEGRVQADLAVARTAVLGLESVLRHPRVPPADKKKKLSAALAGKVSATTLKFLELLIDKKRFDLFPVIVVGFGQLVAEKNKTAKAVVRTARALSLEAQAKLKKGLSDFSGKNVELDLKDDPELIGGVVVRLGDWVLDASLRGRLKNLKETMNGN
jgi:F-type H+-transporting ATPase subunit delta